MARDALGLVYYFADCILDLLFVMGCESSHLLWVHAGVAKNYTGVDKSICLCCWISRWGMDVLVNAEM